MATSWQSYITERKSEFTQDLLQLLRFPSLSADPACQADVQAAAQWVAKRIARAGVENVRLLPPESHPVVYGDWLHAGEGAPTVLIYGHYDVQPADPLELWKTAPFDPAIRDGNVYARGASDMKANLLLPVIALEALLASGQKPPANLKFLFEGQEEIGSPDLPRVIAEHRDLLTCDLVVSADAGQLSETTPALWLGTRGICAAQIDVTGPSRDVHSGFYGGAIQNPLHAIAEIVASLHDSDGRVTVEGFYENVVPIDDDERRRSEAIPITSEHLKSMLGVPEVYGETGYTTYERSASRPTLEVNGIWGGYSGEGAKTVIPSDAHAKITCRLVANQEPRKTIELLEQHIRRHSPIGVIVTITRHLGMAMPYAIRVDHPGNRIAATVLEELYGVQPVPMRIGGTVPIYEVIQRELGVDTVMFGFSQEDEAIHSPNEFYRLSNFELGQRAYCELLLRLADLRL